MTTIVTTHSPQYATLCADQGITSDLIHPDMPKIVRQGTWLIGVCGEDRICDTIQYTATLPQVPKSLTTPKKPIQEWYKWLATRVIPTIQQAIQTIPTTNPNTTPLNGSQTLLITHGHSFLLSETLGITKAEPYWAIGTGANLALGALSQKYNQNQWENHAEHAKTAIEIAKTHDPFTRGAITAYKSYPSGKITKIMPY